MTAFLASNLKENIGTDIGIDRGKWFAAKVLQENSDVITNSGSISLPCIPSNGWRVFPSQNIPSLFNYGHVHYYASF